MNRGGEMSNNSDIRADVRQLLREKNKEEMQEFIDRLCNEVAFSTQKKGGVGFEFELGFCILKLNPYGDKSVHETYPSKVEAIRALDEHNQYVGIPTYESLSKEMQSILCFEAPAGLIPVGKTGREPLVNFESLTPSEKKRQISAKIRKKVVDGVNLLISEREGNTTDLRNYASFEELRDAYQKSLDSQLAKFASDVESSIENWEDLSLQNRASLKIPSATKKRNWVTSQNDPGAFFLNSVRKVLTEKEVHSIAEVLAYSHPILEEEYVSDEKRGDSRKPVNTNDVHGVFTNSNVRKVIETMAKKGFDNQPVYCRKRDQCIGAIRLKEALENLFYGNYNDFETFEDYDKMIEKGLMLHPPPVFLPTDPLDYIVSLFNAGCEAILFKFDRARWMQFNGNSTVSDKLEDGWHILTPHDVVIFMLKHY